MVEKELKQALKRSQKFWTNFELIEKNYLFERGNSFYENRMVYVALDTFKRILIINY